MTTTEQDNDTNTRNHAKHKLALWWLTIQLGWVGHHTGGSRSTQYTRAHHGGKAVGGSTAQSHHNLFSMVAERQCWLLSSKGVQPGRATVSVPAVLRRVKASPRLKHTGKPLRIPPSNQCRNVDDCRMHTCGPRGTCVDGVSSYIWEYFDDFVACSIGSCQPISKMLQSAVFSSGEKKDRAYLTRTSDTPCMIERGSDDECKTRVQCVLVGIVAFSTGQPYGTCSSDSNEGFCVDADC